MILNYSVKNISANCLRT